MSKIKLIPPGLSSCKLGAPGANILHTSKISSNEQFSFKYSGNIWSQIDENLILTYFHHIQGQKGAKICSPGTHILYTSPVFQWA